MSDNASSVDEAARLAKIHALTALGEGLAAERLKIEALVAAATPHLSDLVIQALANTVTAVRAASDMIRGQVALMPPPASADARGDAGGEV